MSGNDDSGAETHPGLTRLVHEIDDVELGDETRLDGGRLTVSAEEAKGLVADPALAEVRVSWASPGESVRIVKVLDAVEPRAKGDGVGGIFPGFLSPARPVGLGATHILRGAAVVAAGYLPRAQESVVEMSGEAAQLSPLGSTHNLVVEFEPSSDASWEDVDTALRRGLLKLAVRLAEAGLEADPTAVEELPAAPAQAQDDRPRVAAITNLQTQGAFKDVFVYGSTMAGSLPTLIDPNELEDGAVVSGQYGHPGLKNPTYIHQNHPVAAALRASEEAELGGVIICPEPVDQAQKELVSALAARLCKTCGFDAAIVTKEGGGNADADIALKVDALEEIGIPAVGLFAEMAGREGTAPPLVAPPTKATAIVSTGNYDEELGLGEVERALGGERIEMRDADAHDAMELPVAAIYCALNPLGWGRLTCEDAT
ncbi:MAG TPA: glycine/sarcosine/betaine reductase component B subunit [Thermoleophilaceae bacterium]|nr:glycine/sarcosine/betaine reductase component B subunit [Thermoleophilaceae bacterium]